MAWPERSYGFFRQFRRFALLFLALTMILPPPTASAQEPGTHWNTSPHQPPGWVADTPTEPIAVHQFKVTSYNPYLNQQQENYLKRTVNAIVLSESRPCGFLSTSVCVTFSKARFSNSIAYHSGSYYPGLEKAQQISVAGAVGIDATSVGVSDLSISPLGAPSVTISANYGEKGCETERVTNNNASSIANLYDYEFCKVKMRYAIWGGAIYANVNHHYAKTESSVQIGNVNQNFIHITTRTL